MALIQNPILRGFNPDPSIIRVGDDYYIATSTFEWFPGVQIHHSKDLVNWRLINRAVNRIEQLDMKGNPDSCGVWAPCLTYDKGTFYLVYTNVRTFDGVWKDTLNYLITTDDIEKGEWSDPIFLNSSGFDASLFHDNNGKKWITNLLVDHRGAKFFGGIILQEYSPEKKKLTGPIKHIFSGTELGITEGPHLYNLNGYYYLITAEGGTEYGHAVSMARSKRIDGPFEIHPKNPIVTSRNNPDLTIQKPGHGDIVQTQTGEWYMVHLGARPLSKLGRCILGRETCIQKVVWKEDNWLYLDKDNNEPDEFVEVPDYKTDHINREQSIEDFSSDDLSVHFQSLRVPMTEDWISLKKRKGWLRLYGRESLCSIHEQSLVARRIRHFKISASTLMDFNPESFQQMAGLVFYYNTMHFHYLHVNYHEDLKKSFLQIITADHDVFNEPLDVPIDISGYDQIWLKGEMDHDKLQFWFALEEGEWKKVGPVLDASILSDDYVRDEEVKYRPAFTGAFVGLCCQDLSGRNKHADFNWFQYIELG
jgi:xylan 1,4-beta-xylosidase